MFIPSILPVDWLPRVCRLINRFVLDLTFHNAVIWLPENEMDKYLKEIFMNVKGEFSSKRTVIFICVVMMIISFIAIVFFGVPVPQWLFENIVYVVIGGLGMVGAEYLGKFKAPKDDVLGE